MISGKQLTVVIMGLVLIFLIFYDLYALFFMGVDSTISAVLKEWSFEAHPLFVFSFGMIIGGLVVHFFEWKPK